MKKIILVAAVLILVFSLTACNTVKKVEKQTKDADSGMEKTSTDNIKVESMNFDTATISEIRESAETVMKSLGTKDSPYGNLAATGIIPIITEEDEIYNLTLEKLDGNDLTKQGGMENLLSSKKVMSSKKIYRNDISEEERVLNLSDEVTVAQLTEFVENYLNMQYPDSPFKWCVENLGVERTEDKKDYVRVYVRPSYDGVVFTRTLVINDGIPTNTASDFRNGMINMTDAGRVDEYYGISPYYNVEKQGDAIGEIATIESILSVVSNKADKESVSEITLFELAYRLTKDMKAVPIWNIVLNNNGTETNYQIDAVTEDVYYE